MHAVATCKLARGRRAVGVATGGLQKLRRQTGDAYFTTPASAFKLLCMLQQLLHSVVHSHDADSMHTVCCGAAAVAAVPKHI